jgi:hypothetical protein
MVEEIRTRTAQKLPAKCCTCEEVVLIVLADTLANWLHVPP